MALVRNLVLGLSAATGGLNKGLDSAMSRLTAWKKSVDKKLSNTTGIKGFSLDKLLGGLSVAGIVGAIKAANDWRDGLNDLAQQAGTSINAIASLDLVAKQSGASSEELGKALNKLGVNLGGNSESAQKDLAKLGLTVGGLSKADRVQALLKISDGFKRLEDPAEKAAIAVGLMGKSAVALIPLLDQGSEAIKRQMDASAALGLTLTKAEDEGIAAFNDEQDKMWASIKGAGLQVLAKFAPALEKTAVFLGLAASAVGKFANQVYDFVKGAGQVLGKWLDKIPGFTQYLQIFGEEFEKAVKFEDRPLVDFGDTVEGTKKRLSELRENGAEAVEKLSEELKKTKLDINTQGLTEGQKKIHEVVDKNKDLYKDLSDRSPVQAAALLTKVEELKKAYADLDAAKTKAETDKSAKDLVEKLQSEIQTFGLVGEAAELYRLRLKGVSEERANEIHGLIAQKKYLEDVKKAQDEAKSLKEKYATPAEKFAMEADKIKKAVSLGGLDQATAIRSLVAARQDAFGKTEFKLPESTFKGSREALISEQRSNAETINASQREQEIAKQILSTNQSAAEYLKSIDKKLSVTGI